MSDEIGCLVAIALVGLSFGFGWWAKGDYWKEKAVHYHYKTCQLELAKRQTGTDSLTYLSEDNFCLRVLNVAAR